MEDNTLKERVKQFLAAERISFTEFGELADVTPAYVNSIKKNISFEVLEKLIKINPAVSLDWLIFGKGSMFTTDTIKIKKLEQENKILSDKVAMLQKIVDLYERQEAGQKRGKN